MKTLNTYWQPTPKKWRKIGDALLLLSAGSSGLVMGLPIDDNTKLWVNFFFGMVGVFGKIATNFASEPKEVNEAGS